MTLSRLVNAARRDPIRAAECLRALYRPDPDRYPEREEEDAAVGSLLLAGHFQDLRDLVTLAKAALGVKDRG